MSAPSRCLATATRNLKNAPAARISQRTFASSTSNSLASPRNATARNTTCLRELQRAQNGSGQTASSHQGQTRTFSQSASRRALKTIDQIRARNKGGPFNLTAAILFVAAGGGLWAYFTYEKERLARKRIAEQTKGMGKPKVGGPFQLIDHTGQPFSNEDMLGKYSLVYFGFTHCPDICPDELDKMALMYDKVKAECGDVLLPLMITCDPARDNPKVLKEYLAEFHPNFIGLTGEYDQIKDTCKAYRVYFSTPSNVKPGQDYLVDHSIYFYLMDPEGDFVEAIGRNFTADQAARVISDHIKDWEKPLKKATRWE
ncbi:SCO1 protein [Stemphylium lycopersici]|uniref:SCO1 protein n=1 Tax=Stemphylium lycopersici TaxID=183478 RepID=A0A364N162_STELY|nr:protein sco1 [Stemphylium lycopersici]RAR07476.1 SCO1 protein [Stemphylium lycopersici]RAR09227.1 SCO1 protein [Stemphylium lycopersici]